MRDAVLHCWTMLTETTATALQTVLCALMLVAERYMRHLSGIGRGSESAGAAAVAGWLMCYVYCPHSQDHMAVTKLRGCEMQESLTKNAGKAGSKMEADRTVQFRTLGERLHSLHYSALSCQRIESQTPYVERNHSEPSLKAEVQKR